MTGTQSNRARSWSAGAGFSALKQRLEPQVGDDFENACALFLQLVFPEINHARRLGVRDKYGIDYFVRRTGTSHMAVVIQTKGFEQDAQTLGRSQVDQCQRSFDKTRKSAKKNGFRIGRYILLINRDLRSDTFRKEVERIGPDMLVKTGVAKSFEIWPAHDLVNRGMDELRERLEQGLSAASRDIALQYLQFGALHTTTAIHGEIPSKWQEHTFDQHSITDSEQPKEKMNDVAAALAERLGDGRIFVVFGEYGFGKSVTASRLVELVSPRPVLFLEAARIDGNIHSTKQFLGLLLKGANVFKTAEALPDYIVRALDDVALFLIRNSEIKPLLIIDGLDEAAVLTAGDGAHRVFNWLKEVQAPVVLTMRTAMWLEAFSRFTRPHATYLIGPKAPRRKTKLTTIELEPWGKNEILSLLEKETAFEVDVSRKTRVSRLRETLSRDEDRFNALFGDIPRRPLFLRMLTAYVAEEDVPDKPLSRNKLMRTFVEMKLHRDSEAPFNHGGSTGRSAIVEGWSFEKRISTSLSLMCGAAGAMTSLHGPFVGLSDSCTLAQAASKANLAYVELDELVVVLNSLLEFDRAQQPSSFDKRRLVFSHRAFQEFFLARYTLDHEEEFVGLKIPMEVTSWLDGEKVK